MMADYSRVAAALGTAVLSFSSATVLSSPVAADELLWAAYAYSPGTGVIGVAINYPDFRPAAQRAMQECQTHPVHPADCQWVVSAPGCVVLAIGTDKSVFAGEGGLGVSIDQAEREAVAKVGPGGLSAWRVCNGTGGPIGDSGIWRD